MITGASGVLDELLSLGIRVAPRPGGVLNLAPKNRITSELIQKVREHKAELLTILLDKQAAGRDKPLPYSRASEVAAWCEEHHIDASVGAEVLRIEPEALHLDWNLERLWGARFWPVNLRGLAAVIDPGDSIGIVTTDFIEIIKADWRKTRQTFCRIDAEREGERNFEPVRREYSFRREGAREPSERLARRVSERAKQ